MPLKRVRAGDDPPESINVMVEVPRGSSVKYELDPKTGVIFVDRFLFTATYYPFNYGFIPETKGKDGDPLDAIVLSQEAVFPMAIIRSRPVAVLLTEDEEGIDPKIVAVPGYGVDPFYSKIKSEDEMPEFTKSQIEHFFSHYKETEPGKFVKIKGWDGAERSKKLIVESVRRYNKGRR